MLLGMGHSARDAEIGATVRYAAPFGTRGSEVCYMAALAYRFPLSICFPGSLSHVADIRTNRLIAMGARAHGRGGVELGRGRALGGE